MRHPSERYTDAKRGKIVFYVKGSDSLQPPYHRCDQAQSSHIGFEFSVKAGCISSKVLEVVEGTIDDISLTIELLVIVILQFEV